MSSKIIRARLFCFAIDTPLKGGNIEVLCKEDKKAFNLYREFREFKKFKTLNPSQKERKEKIIDILQKKIYAMIAKKEINNQGEKTELDEKQLSLF